MNAKTSADHPEFSAKHKRRLFVACFVALMATSFAFMVRAMLISTWGEEFNLSNTQLGEIMGVGLWPFALSIVLLSLVIDRIGYGKAMILAFVLHVASTIILMMASGYWMLYLGTFILALGNGTVEGTINPLVASMFPKEKAKWLTILHAGWPGGMIIGGILGMALGEGTNWQYKVALTLLPIAAYGIMMIPKKFPVHERVLAGIPYKEMLREAGALGALVIVALLVFQIGNFFEASLVVNLVIIGMIVGTYGFYTRSWGQPLFIFLLIIMFPLATTELATDSWMVDLMSSELGALGLQAGWILVYTALIMTIFRFIGGPLIRFFTPVGLLMLCSAVAAIGLFFLSIATTALLIVIAATVYSFGKSYFYPTMLGIVGEQFPKGGALTINITLGVGLMAAGIVGSVFLGYVQDISIDQELARYDRIHDTELYEQYLTLDKKSILGTYRAIDMDALKKASEADKEVLTTIQLDAKKRALRSVAILPLVMFVCYVILFLYFRAKGGYRPVEIEKRE